MANGESPTVDLRSDTVTRPTRAMREAMALAEVGDDGYREDPTVRKLEERFADMVGKDRALFVPSGTMANQIALSLLARPGTNVVAGWRAHIVNHEAGAGARNSLVQFLTVDDTDGVMAVDDIRWAIEAGRHHHVDVSAVMVENTHMASGGTPLPLDSLRAIASLRIPVHMDGARLFNASIATGVDARSYAAMATTVMACLSKGLGAPVGSLLAFPEQLYEPALRERKRLGGAMRQAGVIAAAGIVALDQMVGRLAQDHERAAALRKAVDECFPDSLTDPGGGGTNIVCFQVDDTDAVLASLEASGVLAGTVAPGVIRLVTHYGIDDAGLERAIAALERAAAPAPGVTAAAPA